MGSSLVFLLAVDLLLPSQVPFVVSHAASTHLALLLVSVGVSPSAQQIV